MEQVAWRRRSKRPSGWLHQYKVRVRRKVRSTRLCVLEVKERGRSEFWFLGGAGREGREEGKGKLITSPVLSAALFHLDRVKAMSLSCIFNCLPSCDWLFLPHPTWVHFVHSSLHQAKSRRTALTQILLSFNPLFFPYSHFPRSGTWCIFTFTVSRIPHPSASWSWAKKWAESYCYSHTRTCTLAHTHIYTHTQPSTSTSTLSPSSTEEAEDEGARGMKVMMMTPLEAMMGLTDASRGSKAITFCTLTEWQRKSPALFSQMTSHVCLSLSFALSLSLSLSLSYTFFLPPFSFFFAPLYLCVSIEQIPGKCYLTTSFV